MIDETQLARLAALGHALRPDWPTKSLLTYLHAHHAHRPYRDIAVALAWVAADTGTKTPKRLEENGPWWQAVTADVVEVTRTPPALMQCARCGGYATEPNHHEHCGRRADPDAAAEYATLARNAARAGATVAKARARNHQEDTP